MKSLKQYILSFTLIFSILASFPLMAGNSNRKFTLVIDPGHGGKDMGAVDNGAKEKNINLAVALQLKKILKSKLKDINVVMTRDDDSYLTLQERADIANKAKGDLFISIHTNSVDKKNRNRRSLAGSSVYALGLHKDENNMKVARRENSVIELESNYEQKYKGFDPNKDESYIIFEMAQKKNLSKSIRFAEEAQKEMVKSGRKNRGVHQAGFWVLWATSMPSVLVELDFICNPNSAKYLTSGKGVSELSGALFKAVEKYYSSWSGGNAVKYDQNTENTGQASSLGADYSEDETNASYDDMTGNGERYAALLQASERKQRVDVPEGRKSSNSYATARKRRNTNSRTSSDRRVVETGNIPLHSENERAASLIALSEESDNTTSLLPPQPQLSEKERKKLEKQAKKEKKKKEKEAKKREKKQRKQNAHNAKIEKFVTVYKIQILASAELLKQNNPRFCGLTPISTYKENNLYKYYFGESTDESEIQTMLKDVRKKIPDAFIVSATKSVVSAKK